MEDEEEMSPTGSGIFNSKKMQKIKRQGKPCIFRNKLSKNVMKYLFDFFYYRELYNLGSVNLYFYQCFTDYQLLTWKIEMNNIIDIFHLEIKNKEEVDDTLTKCISNKRTYNMIDHPGCFVRINKDGINIISSAYYDNTIKKEINLLNKNNTAGFMNNNLNLDFINDKLSNLNTNNNNIIENESPIKSNNNTENFTLSEPPSNIGSAESIKNLKLSDSFIWKKEFIDGSYIINTPCINLIKTAPLDFGFSFYHIIKGDYQLYLNHCLINMRNARLILKVFINKHNVYSLKNFPSNDLIEQFESSQSEKSPIIKLKEYLICSITKKMFDDVCNLEKNENNETTNDFEIRVVFQNIDLFWKAGWCIDGGRLLRKVYEINESNKNSDFKRFKSDNIDICVIKKYEEDKNIKLKGMKNKKRNSVGDISNIFS